MSDCRFSIHKSVKKKARWHACARSHIVHETLTVFWMLCQVLDRVATCNAVTYTLACMCLPLLLGTVDPLACGDQSIGKKGGAGGHFLPPHHPSKRLPPTPEALANPPTRPVREVLGRGGGIKDEYMVGFAWFMGWDISVKMIPTTC